MTTLAPAARHACACAFCFCGSFRALVIDAVTPAALNALAKSGASKSTQRTDDLVSGSRTQTWTLAAFFFVLAVAPATATTAASAAITPTRANDFLLESFLTLLASSLCTGENARQSYSPMGIVQPRLSGARPGIARQPSCPRNGSAS